MSELSYFAFQEAIRHHIPVRICHAHNAPVFRYETWVEKLKHISRIWMAGKIRDLSTDYFTCSQVAGDWLFGRKNRDKVQFMPNAIEAEAFAWSAQKAADAKKQFGWADKVVIGHVGRFNKQKNHSFLIDIFHAFYQKHPDSILVLVGKGELMLQIRQKVHSLGLDDCVFFMGVRSDMPQLYWAFDVLLFPSFYEGLPVSLVEAQAAGLPCVVSNRISEQTKIISSYTEVPLQVSSLEWAEHVEEALSMDRKNTSLEIKKAGFDIETNAEWLTRFYLDKLIQI